MKPIKDFEGYFIDEHGNVYSSKTGELRKLSTFTYNSGYKAVKLYKNNKGYGFAIHRLVAIHYVDGYQDEAVVDHIDCDKLNNHYLNLRWVSQSENLKHIDKVINFTSCVLYQHGVKLKEFKTLTEMRKYVESEFGISGKSLQKYGYNNKIGLTLERCRDYPRGE